MVLVGSKVKLRPIEEKDIEMKVKWINDPDVHKYLHYEIPINLEETIKWFKRVSQDKTRHDLIIETLDNLPIGVTGLIGINSRYQTAEFYIAIGDKNYWGKGIGTEVAFLVSKWAFESLELYKLWATIRAQNESMIAMMKKIGYQVEGLLRQERVVDGKRVDLVRIGLLKNEINNLIENKNLR